MPTTSGIVQIPERFQIVHGLGPFDAAVRALPFIVTIPAVSLLCAIVVTKYKIKHAYALLIGTVFQVLGSVLFAYLSSSASIDPAEYGFQVLLAVGLGINNTILVTSIPHMTQRALIRKLFSISFTESPLTARCVQPRRWGQECSSDISAP